MILLPEILSAVLANLKQRSDLLRCAQVNRAWYSEAIRLLWRGDFDSHFANTIHLQRTQAPSDNVVWKLLKSTDDPARVRYYSDSVAWLVIPAWIVFTSELTARIDESNYLDNLRPRIASVRIDHKNAFSKWMQLKEILRGVVAFELFAVTDPSLKSVVTCLNTSLPNLQLLRISFLSYTCNCHTDSNTVAIQCRHDILGLVNEMKTLKYLEVFGLDKAPKPSNPGLEKFFRNPNLQYLNLEYEQSLQSPWDMQEFSCARLRTLYVRIFSASGLSSILSHLPKLELLQVTVDQGHINGKESVREILETLSYCPNLHSLTLYASRELPRAFEPRLWLNEENIITLKRTVPKLQSFRFWLPNEQASVEMLWDGIEALATHFPSLTSLSVPVSGWGTLEILDKFPSLRHLSLDAEDRLDFHDFCRREMSRWSQKFPCLRHLYIQNIDFDHSCTSCAHLSSREYAARLATPCQSVFPNIVSICDSSSVREYAYPMVSVARRRISPMVNEVFVECRKEKLGLAEYDEGALCRSYEEMYVQSVRRGVLGGIWNGHYSSGQLRK